MTTASLLNADLPLSWAAQEEGLLLTEMAEAEFPEFRTVRLNRKNNPWPSERLNGFAAGFAALILR